MTNYCVYSGGNGTSGAVAGSVPTATEWSNAYQNISACLTAIVGGVEGDIIYVAHDHNYTGYIAATTWSVGNVIHIISIDRNNTTTAIPLEGALEGTNGNFLISVSSTTTSGAGLSLYMYGITLRPGTGTSSGSTNIVLNSSSTTAGIMVFERCLLWINSTNGSPTISVGSGDVGGVPHKTVLKNCRFKFGNSAQKLLIACHPVVLNGCSIDASSSLPAAALHQSTGRGMATLHVSACDFSLATALFNLANDNNPLEAKIINCIVPSTLTTGAHPGAGSIVLELNACGTSTDDHNYQYFYIEGSGQILHNTGIYLTSGAATFTDTGGSAIPVSLNTVSSSTASRVSPLYGPWFNVFVSAIGSKTFSIKLAYDNSTALQDVNCWLELEYMGNTAHPGTTNVVNAPVVSGTNSIDILATGTNLTNTNEAWSGTSGWANKNTATLSKTVTINQIGWARARVCLAKPSTTIYVDPQLTVV